MGVKPTHSSMTKGCCSIARGFGDLRVNKHRRGTPGYVRANLLI
jgi:hypothetical protein